MIGALLGLAILALGIAVIQYVKKFFPDEVSIQQRHDGPSDEVARRTVIAQLVQAGKDTGIGRRGMILGTAGLATGVFGIGLGIAAVAPLVRNPWKGGPDAALWHTGWRPVNGETVYLRYDTGDPDGDRAGPTRGPGAGLDDDGLPVPRLRAGQRGRPAGGRPPGGQPDHADPAAAGHRVRAWRRGTRASTTATTSPTRRSAPTWAARRRCFESQTNRILCPCHQSQFVATEHARPVFGPAARPLPQLPITVNDEGYFVATGDFAGPSVRRSGRWGRYERDRPRRPPAAAAVRSARPSTSWTSASTRRPACAGSSTRSSRRTGRSCSARSRSTASSSC